MNFGKNIFLHQANLNTQTQRVTLAVEEDYSVVSGLSLAGLHIHPRITAGPAAALVPAGALGLPYVADLGQPGALIDLDFAAPVTALVLATYSAVRPIVVPIISLTILYPAFENGTTNGRYKYVTIYLSDGSKVLLEQDVPDLGNLVDATFHVGAKWLGMRGYPHFGPTS